MSFRRGALVLAAALWPAAAAAASIAIDLDPRMELESAAKLLGPAGSDPDGFMRRDIPYARAIEKRFAKFRDHSAVAAESQTAFKSFKFSDRRQFLLRLSPPPVLSEKVEMPYAFYDRAGGRKSAEGWIASLRAFSRDTDFEKFFAESRASLAPEIGAFRSEVARVDFLGKLEDYAGLKLLGTYSIALSPLDATGSVANEVAILPDGSMEIASVVGPEAKGAGIDFWSKRVPSMLWHESGHGVLDDLTDLFGAQVDLSSAAYRPGWGCYGDWRQCVKEQIVRAVMIRLIARQGGQAAADEQLAFETTTRFPYLAAMIDALKEYEAHRKKYPTLADFYPRLLDVLPSHPSRKQGLEFSTVPAQVSGAPEAKALRLRKYITQVAERAGDRKVKAAAKKALEGIPWDARL